MQEKGLGQKRLHWSHLKGWKNLQAFLASSPITEALVCHSFPPNPWVVVTPTSKHAAARPMYSALQAISICITNAEETLQG